MSAKTYEKQVLTHITTLAAAVDDFAAGKTSAYGKLKTAGDHMAMEAKYLAVGIAKATKMTGKADDKVCGQILRYMGYVRQEIAGERRVRGLIVANDFSEGLKYAVQAMPDVVLKRYEVRFSFSEVR